MKAAEAVNQRPFRCRLLARRVFYVASAVATIALAVVVRAQPPPATHTFDAAHFKALHWRSIGPYRGGRVTAVAGVANQPLIYYMGATGGGVWKTDDAGIT